MSKRCGKTRFSPRRQPFGLWLLVAVLIAWATAARAQPPIASVAGCGKIARSGLYILDTSVVAAEPGDCITIAAPNVVLDLNGATLTGSGTGAGVHLTTKARNSFIEGRGATISGFSDGIEIDGSKNTVENLTVSSNTDAGVLLKAATQAAVANLTATNNTNDGIRVEKGSYNNIDGSLSVTSNGRYGIWLRSTSNNNVGGFFAADNAIAGVYAGCGSDGPVAGPCKPAAAASKNNSIFNGRVQASAPGAQSFGVVLDLGDDSNHVTNITSGSPYEQFDLDDENPACAHNAWFGHGIIFSSSPIDCIH